MNGATSRADEGRHVPGPEHWWEESWHFDIVAPDGTIGAFVRLALYPVQRRAWCWVYVVRDDGTVVVRDHDVPPPSAGSLLARSEGLWCELLCETPLEHWSIGVEAFGVRLDDPMDGVRGEVGTRLPVGLDLEWEADTPPGPLASMAGYLQTGAVHGEVLLGKEVIAFDGAGTRRHAWGVRDWTRPARSLWCESDAGDLVAIEPLLHAVVPLAESGVADAALTRSLVRCHFDTPEGELVDYGWLEQVHRGEPRLPSH